jgi:CHAD domain-containing protein
VDRRSAPRRTPAAPSLTDAERSDVALKGLLQQLLTVMQVQRPGVIAGLDSERLHDYRVALRRSRALLDQLPQVLPQRIEARYGKRLATLGTLTTPLRDLDVLLLKFDGYRTLLPEARQGHLAPVREMIETQRQRARQQLIKQLQSADYNRFVKAWQNYLHSAVPMTTPLANARRPIKALADERIWQLYKRALRQGRAISKNSPASDLHTLRKTCKKLRYLLDAFQVLYPEKKIIHMIAVLKELQDQLGEFQDLCVHRQLFAAVQQLPLPDDECTNALDELLHHLKKQQQRQQQRFHGCFKTFASKKHYQRFKELFKP